MNLVVLRNLPQILLLDLLLHHSLLLFRSLRSCEVFLELRVLQQQNWF